MDFDELLTLAKTGSEPAIVEITEQYKPLMLKESIIHGVFDDDFYQEACMVLLKCIRYFRKIE